MPELITKGSRRIRHLTTIFFIKWHNFDADSGVCGAYTRKLFHCAPFAHNILSVYSILKGDGAYAEKLSPCAPLITKKWIW